MNPIERFDADRPVIGMIHLPALPGSPGYEADGDGDGGGGRGAIRARMREDAAALVDGGVDGVVLENFGDAPFYPDDVPPHVVADMTALATELVGAVDVPVGINVLRNDAASALSVAAASGASFVRVNVHVGAAATDQGLVEGRAHETMRLRERLDAAVAVLADVHVKHATPLGDARIERVARETVERGRADGVIVSGTGTGVETDRGDLERVSDAMASLEEPKPVFVGSGVTAETVGDVLAAGADGVVVGSALKESADPTNPVARERVTAVVEAARSAT